VLQITSKVQRHYLDDINAPGSTTYVAEFGQGVEIQNTSHMDAAGNDI
jgi:hypothetical protein